MSCKKEKVQPRLSLPKEYIPTMAGIHKMVGKYYYGCSVPGQPSTDTTVFEELDFDITVLGDSVTLTVNTSSRGTFNCFYRSYDTVNERLRFITDKNAYDIEYLYYYFNEDSILYYAYNMSTFCRYEETLHTE
ncbi:hypothetical protein GCM10023093_20780 [Nemorincola caseinilytica]|uniref:Uncharacterized protein n=1 Tax=Nemorincola caseinilytica TaxID=2054315 RepID=A0ABP8NJD7_9BACT